MTRLSKQIFAFLLMPFLACAFAPIGFSATNTISTKNYNNIKQVTSLKAAVPDLDIIALVVGQENYGLAIVCLGEAVWSLVKAPSVDHALKTLVPAGIAAGVLAAVSGPMVTSGDVGSVETGLWIATAVSVGLGASYVARLLAPFSPSPKEIAALGLLVAFAGFFSFSQNLLVDGFVTLPSIDLPALPFTIELPYSNNN
jgi:ethanolamine utilization microcompartment shell protein EutS